MVKGVSKKKIKKAKNKVGKVDSKVGKRKVKKLMKKKIIRIVGDSIRRVSSGVPNFDSMVQGGLEKNSTNLIIGGSGSGKSIFATQFLLAGLNNGERCLYVTFEEKREEFFENMLEFGWDLKSYEKKGLFVFLEYSPIKVKTMLEEGGGSIESIILKNKITRIVIDSITSFALLFEDELAKREAALALFGMIRGWNATALLTLEENPLGAGNNSSKTLEFEADSLIALYFVRKKLKRERFVEILKMRGTNHSKQIYPAIIGKSGMRVSKRAVSGFR